MVIKTKQLYRYTSLRKKIYFDNEPSHTAELYDHLCFPAVLGEARVLEIIKLKLN